MKNIFQKKSFKIFVIAILLLLTGAIYFQTQATNFSWMQSGWLGGQSANTATHSTDANNTWTNFSAKDNSTNINGSGDAQLKKADNVTETTDADFNTNTSKDSSLAVSGNSIKLLKADGATCSIAGDCQSNTCTGNLCVAAFTCGTSTVIGRSPDTTTYQTVLGADGNCWLKSNLGTANVATAFNDSSAYGWLYQWGRLTDGHQITTSGTTPTNATTDTPGHANFITEGTSPYDWRVPQNNNLWQGVSGVNNPCPTGFRLPTQTEWATEVTAAGITNYTTAFNSSLKLTAAGNRYGSTAALLNQGSYGNYWSSSPSGANAFIVNFSSGGVNPANLGNRANGFAVRCLKN